MSRLKRSFSAARPTGEIARRCADVKDSGHAANYMRMRKRSGLLARKDRITDLRAAAKSTPARSR